MRGSTVHIILKHWMPSKFFSSYRDHMKIFVSINLLL